MIPAFWCIKERNYFSLIPTCLAEFSKLETDGNGLKLISFTQLEFNIVAFLVLKTLFYENIFVTSLEPPPDL